MPALVDRIAQELCVRPAQVAATIEMIEEGATIPFIARYRKERTGGLDDTQIRNLDDRLRYLRDLEERKQAVIKTIEAQGKLTAALKQQIVTADTKTRLEDLYLPYRKKRRTKAQIAREAGLEPLADLLFNDPSKTPETEAQAFLNPDAGVNDPKAALDGARRILTERFAEEADLVARLREVLDDQGHITAQVADGKQDQGAKFSDYFDHSEPLKSCPSHRALALFRGRNENILTLALTLPDEAELPRGTPGRCERLIAAHFGIRDGYSASAWLTDCVRWCWKVKLSLSLELDLFTRLRDRAERRAIEVFADNLKDLLMSAPAGPRATIGLDPGIRTGVKVAVVDATGKLVDTATVYPFAPRNDADGAIATLAALIARHDVDLCAVGNGTGSRETERLMGRIGAQFPARTVTTVVVNEAGASVYSASKTGAEEFPDLDVSLRGAVSIARRLQDPLAELVKIDPKSIGVGQYQHDVSETRLARQLEAVVEDCVNAVGVDLNTASAPLLARVSGLSDTLAGNIVSYRDVNGAFRNRAELCNVPRLGPKAFEQSAGFLRIRDGDNPLDASAVHPEAYDLVAKIRSQTGSAITALIGDVKTLKKLDAAQLADDRFGVPTIRDVIAELEKPGRDPRPVFKTARFADGVEEITDLRPGMRLEGTVTNVTNFGAFVDVGVHQDGLVHISRLADRFVSDPREVVKVGEVVSVKVMEIDVGRRRIALSMRKNPDDARATQSRPDRRQTPGPRRTRQNRSADGALADAFASAQRRKR